VVLFDLKHGLLQVSSDVSTRSVNPGSRPEHNRRLPGGGMIAKGKRRAIWT
jgi:hypothetical protein